MSRRSKRIQDMSKENPNESLSSSADESDNERTLKEENAIAVLRDEIEALKMSLESLKNSTTSKTTSEPPLMPVELPLSSTVTPLMPVELPLSSTVTQTTMSYVPPPINQKISMPNYLNFISNHMPQSSSIPNTQLPTYSTNFQNQTVPPSTPLFAHQPLIAPTTSSFRNNIPENIEPSASQHQNFQPFRKLFDLPEFTGEPELWPMFFVSYKETTAHYKYTKLENLFRLQKALKGNARTRVAAYLIHPESVDQVMNTLEFYYGRPNIMIRSQINKARAFPAISAKNISEIINFSTMVSNVVAFLENAGATPHLFNPTLLDELVNKLPIIKREEWVKYSVTTLGQYPTIRQFSEWLQNVATYISLVTEIDPHNDETAKVKNNKFKQSFAITIDDRTYPKCVLCHNNHPLSQCLKFKKFSIAQRWQIVKDNSLCFSCLVRGHNTFKCSRRRQCGILECPKFHNRLLHEKNFNKNDNVKSKQMNTIHSDGKPTSVDTLTSERNDINVSSRIEHNDNDSVSVTTILDNCFNKKTLFKYLPVKLSGPAGSINIMAFIDDGSKVSLLEECIANKIGLKGPKRNLSLGWIGGKKSNELSMKLELEIGNLQDNNCSFHMKNVRTVEHLGLPSQSLQTQVFKNMFPTIKDVAISDYNEVKPKLLIGLPHIRLVRPHQIINIDDNFSVHRTALGNILFGSNEENSEPNVFVIEVNEVDEIKQQMADYFSLENFGIKTVSPVVSDDDLRAEKILKDTTVHKGEYYETGLLWKNDKYDFKETYSMAYKRLQNVENKMRKDNELATWYINKIEEYKSKGYIRKLSKEESLIKTDRTWYLPHFVITNVNKGNKRRLVFDAAAVVDGESLNSRLLKGPAKYQPKPLLSILFKFRQRKIAVCGDIREMFHRVRIRNEDQVAQRFLWRSGVSESEPEEFVMQAMIFGSTSSPCSAQYVKNLNAEKYKEISARAYESIVDCHYVDDYVDNFDTTDEAIAVTKSVIEIHKRAGFELRGFISNSPDFDNAINDPECLGSLKTKSLSISESMAEKVLGLFWESNQDLFYFILKFSNIPEVVLKGERKPTKREVLSLVMSIFDPFGFLANIVIRSKIILQELWAYDIDWNSQIPDNIYKKWREWYFEIQNAQYIKISRYYNNFSDPSAIIDLHIFVDASEAAFAAVGYWRVELNNNIEIVFVAGKSRCAPLKPLSIPRLELQAAVLGVRLQEVIVSGHNIKPRQIIFWSDSKTVVKWIQSDCRVYKQFVSHRISEILEHSKVQQWRWVPGSKNPADDATRPQYFSGNAQQSRWLNGPDFLKLDEDHWPKLIGEIDKQIHDSEKRSKFIFSIVKSYAIIPYEENSNYNRLLRVKCWIDRAIKIFKSFVSHQSKSSLNLKPFITFSEIQSAEKFWCQLAQNENFKDEYNQLKTNQYVSKRSSIYKLSPYLADDGLIRVAGRISKATFVNQCTREPIIMPKNHIITKLIVKKYHEDYYHQNQEAICAAIRIKFWIPSLRQIVRAAKKNCQLCKNRSATPKAPLMGQLPIDRISPFVRPFTYTGIDYLGPYTVAIGRRCEKRWVSLFTCMTTRAIHLELAKDLSAEAVILCIRNFVNRRGVPIRIRSDRGTNFVGASKEDFIRNNIVLGDECTRRGIEWIFNTPANPSEGGAWERMVRAVKNVLSFTLKEKSPQVETFYSLLIEAENLVNSRPLTHLSIENVDSEPLTPNHFLLGCPNIVKTPAVNENVCLRKQWHILQRLKQTFWKRWVLEYLPDLTRRTKWYQRAKPLQLGDVVVICDENEERGKWKKGMVEEIFKANDGQVRSAVVKTVHGRLRRPASKLAVLDVNSESP